MKSKLCLAFLTLSACSDASQSDVAVPRGDVEASETDAGVQRVGEPATVDELDDAGSREPEPEPAPPPELQGDPAQPGPYAVFEQPVRFEDTNQASVYAPSRDQGASFATDAGKFPLIVLMPAFTKSYPSYEGYARAYASWGFVVVGLNFANQGDHERNRRQALSAIAWATSPDTPLSAVVDAQRIVTTGHSLGGKIAFFAAATDPRIKVVVGIEPVDTGGAPCSVPVAGASCNKWSVAPNSFEGDTGSMDTIQAAVLIFHAPPAEGFFSTNPKDHNSLRFWEGAKAPALMLKFPAAKHLDWGVREGKWDAITVRTQIAFLLKHLYGMVGTDAYLTGDVIQRDVAAGTVQLEVKE